VDGVEEVDGRDVGHASTPGFLARTLALILAHGVLLVFGFTALPRAAQATGPDLPLAFVEEPEAKDPWTLVLALDPREVTDVAVERVLYLRGTPTRTEIVEIKPGAATGDRGAALVPLPLRFPGIERLQPGVYAEKIVMEGRWAPGRGGVHPLRVERWIYFRVDRGRVERLSIEEYSAIADPPDVARDAGGGAALIHRGGDTKTDVPLDKTRGTPAAPLGRLGGVPEEPIRDQAPGPGRYPTDATEADEK
jgi:hypothetical protein